MRAFILLLMIFLHIYDDYHLQGILASMKQKVWWKDNAPNRMYKYDYLMALFCHAFSWSFMIMLPIAAYYKFTISNLFICVFLLNVLTHAAVDDLKANQFKINLIQDQTCHFAQIIATFIALLIP